MKPIKSRIKYNKALSEGKETRERSWWLRPYLKQEKHLPGNKF